MSGSSFLSKLLGGDTHEDETETSSVAEIEARRSRRRGEP